jgi:uncharacterized damage-inducible protein DinB
MNPKELFAHWKDIRSGLIATVESFKDSELTHVPFPGSRPVGGIMLHIADAEDGWLRYIVTQELEKWPDHYLLANYPTKKEILQILEEVHAHTLAHLERIKEKDLHKAIKTPWEADLSLYWIFWHVIEHEIHHRGELSLILGLLGREGLDV